MQTFSKDTAIPFNVWRLPWSWSFWLAILVANVSDDATYWVGVCISVVRFKAHVKKNCIKKLHFIVYLALVNPCAYFLSF